MSLPSFKGKFIGFKEATSPKTFYQMFRKYECLWTGNSKRKSNLVYNVGFVSLPAARRPEQSYYQVLTIYSIRVLLNAGFELQD